MKNCCQKLMLLWSKLEPAVQDLALLFVRITIGWQFFNTGKGKLAHIEKTTEFFASLDLPAPEAHAYFVGGLEMIGGLMLVAGLLTRVISIPLIVTMSVAYMTAHRAEAFASIGDFGDQEPFAFLMGCLITLAFGAGRVSLDRAIGWKRPFGGKRH